MEKTQIETGMDSHHQQLEKSQHNKRHLWTAVTTSGWEDSTKGRYQQPVTTSGEDSKRNWYGQPVISTSGKLIEGQMWTACRISIWRRLKQEQE